jgi:hypothetical protein
MPYKNIFTILDRYNLSNYLLYLGPLFNLTTLWNEYEIYIKSHSFLGCQWLTPIILAAHKAEIRKITVRNQRGQMVLETLSWRNPAQKRADGGTGWEFKPQYHKQTNKTAFSTNSAEIPGRPFVKEWSWALPHNQKLTQNESKT